MVIGGQITDSQSQLNHISNILRTYINISELIIIRSCDVQ
jgi:hypothetical protein